MARTNKKTRIKGLPPRIQLAQQDAATGSYPTIPRIASDNRTGVYKVNWDDRFQTNLGTITRISNSFKENLLWSYTFASASKLDTVFAGHVQWRVLPDYLNTALLSSSLGRDITITSGNIAIVGPNTGSATVIQGENTSYPLNGNAATDLNNLFVPRWLSLKFNQYEVTSAADLRHYESTISDQDIGSFIKINADVEPSFSVEFWISYAGATGESNRWSNILWFANEDIDTDPTFTIGGDAEYGIYIDENSQLNFRLFNSGALWEGIIKTANDKTPTNKWTHYAVTYDGSKSTDGMKIYKNGVLVGSSGSTTGSYVGMKDASAAIAHGPEIYSGGSSSTSVFNGFGGRISAFNRVLTEDEIKVIYGTKQNLGSSFLDGVVGGTGLGYHSRFLLDREQDTDITPVTSSVVKQVADDWVSYTPGQNLLPYKDNGNPAVDGKSNGRQFYATGSDPKLFGDALKQPLWSKTKVEIDIPVSAPTTHEMFLSSSRVRFDIVSGRTVPSSSVQGLNYPMCYYNAASKKWEGIGLGVPFSTRGLTTGSFTNQDLLAWSYPTWGFTPGIINVDPIVAQTTASNAPWRSAAKKLFEWQASAGSPMTRFGFPHDARYHATSSQLISLNNKLTEPFLVEKIVVEMSAAYQISSASFNVNVFDGSLSDATLNHITESAAPACVSNVFILNQRRNVKFIKEQSVGGTETISSNSPTFVSLSAGGPLVRVDTIRDLIAWGAVSSIASNLPVTQSRSGSLDYFTGAGGGFDPSTGFPRQNFERDVTLEQQASASNDLTAINWSGSLKFELECRSPAFVGENGLGLFLGAFNDNLVFSKTILQQNGGRNGLGVISPSGRDFASPITSLPQREKTPADGYFVPNPFVSFFKYDELSRPNPYILYPDDNLIIGWQQPIPAALVVSSSTSDSHNVLSGSFSSVTFLPGPAKIILYGSTLREGRERHETLNQLLTSNAVHEVIE